MSSRATVPSLVLLFLIVLLLQRHKATAMPTSGAHDVTRPLVSEWMTMLAGRGPSRPELLPRTAPVLCLFGLAELTAFIPDRALPLGLPFSSLAGFRLSPAGAYP